VRDTLFNRTSLPEAIVPDGTGDAKDLARLVWPASSFAGEIDYIVVRHDVSLWIGVIDS
jgi:hypothetical protein